MGRRRAIYMDQINYSDEIRRLKQNINVLILAHYYVNGDVQDVSDFVGDSSFLLQIALEAKEQIIIFCGARFMAESAKILIPSKAIITTDDLTGCPMAHMVTPYEIKQVRKHYNNLAVVCYINSTSEVKSLSDVCVTSSNAVKIINSLKEKNIFFIPNQNMGTYLQHLLPHKNFILNHSFCYVHSNLTKDNLTQLLRSIPDAKVLAHPACPFNVLEMADFVGSTSGVLEYARQSNHKKFIICTGINIFHKLIKDNPDKQFYTSKNNEICPNIQKITLEKVYDSLVSLGPEVHITENIRKKAKEALKKMYTLDQL